MEERFKNVMKYVAKEIPSTDGQYKAVIQQRAARLLEVSVFKWTHEFVPGHGEVVEPYWDKIAGPSLTDRLELAEQLANEELRAWSGQPQS